MANREALLLFDCSDVSALLLCRTLGVMANADTPEDAQTARANGAEGLGLCRTEHMFFSTEERIKAVRKMIVAQSKEARVKALDELLPFQRSDFEGLFKAMEGLPVTIRLLDPPLHEFLPDGDVHEVVAMLAKETGASAQDIQDTIERLEELNPMLGFRGCRLAITYPEIAEMQVGQLGLSGITLPTVYRIIPCICLLLAVNQQPCIYCIPATCALWVEGRVDIRRSAL